MTKNLPFCFCVSDLCCLFGKFRTVSVFLTEKKCSTYIFGGNLRFFDTSMRQNVLKVTIKVKTCHFEFCACVLCYFVVFYFVFVSMIIHHLQQAHRVMANINTPIEGTSMLSFKKMLPMKKKTKSFSFSQNVLDFKRRLDASLANKVSSHLDGYSTCFILRFFTFSDKIA